MCEKKMALTKAHSRMIENAPVNVKDFGATGDGSTDDTSAIQAAVTAAANKSLYIPAGITP
jgi:polygalacturonase